MAAKKKTAKKTTTSRSAAARTGSRRVNGKSAKVNGKAAKVSTKTNGSAKTNGAVKAAAKSNGKTKPRGKTRWPSAATASDAGPLSAEDAYEIGRIIAEKFEGKLSLREISEQEKLSRSSGALHRCLAVYRVCTNLNTRPGWEHLGFSHLNRLDALTPAQQKKLANQAEKQKWSVDRIEREVTRLRQSSSKVQRRGRPALPRFAKAAHQLRRFTDGRDNLLGDLDSATELELERLRELHGQVSQVRTQLDKLDVALKRAIRTA